MIGIGRLIAIIILILHSTILLGQLKYEKESRIKESAVPTEAVQFVRSMQLSGKIKWYKEENLEGFTFEAKGRHQSNKYSIEFDSVGSLEDVEIVIKWVDIPNSARASIKSYFDSHYDSFNTRKIQVQYSGSVTDPQLITKSMGLDSLRKCYEIVTQVRYGKKHQEYEYLFAHDGSFISSSLIIHKNTDNLEF